MGTYIPWCASGHQRTPFRRWLSPSTMLPPGIKLSHWAFQKVHFPTCAILLALRQCFVLFHFVSCKWFVIITVTLYLLIYLSFLKISHTILYLYYFNPLCSFCNSSHDFTNCSKIKDLFFYNLYLYELYKIVYDILYIDYTHIYRIHLMLLIYVCIKG